MNAVFVLNVFITLSLPRFQYPLRSYSLFLWHDGHKVWVQSIIFLFRIFIGLFYNHFLTCNDSTTYSEKDASVLRITGKRNSADLELYFYVELIYWKKIYTNTIVNIIITLIFFIPFKTYFFKYKLLVKSRMCVSLELTEFLQNFKLGNINLLYI